jgi:hypothetical protein
MIPRMRFFADRTSAAGSRPASIGPALRSQAVPLRPQLACSVAVRYHQVFPMDGSPPSRFQANETLSVDVCEQF